MYVIQFGIFLGYIVSASGIEANPEKIPNQHKDPTKIKDVISLNKKIAALNQFISKSTDKCTPVFDQVKKGTNLKWAKECQMDL